MTSNRNLTTGRVVIVSSVRQCDVSYPDRDSPALGQAIPSMDPAVNPGIVRGVLLASSPRSVATRTRCSVLGQRTLQDFGVPAKAHTAEA
jgi:hypothetical protein